MMTMGKSNHFTAAEISRQIKGEAEAVLEYEHFLGICQDLTHNDVMEIQEIISDEKNHLLILQAMAKRHDGGIAASPDGAGKAIAEISAGIGKGC
jgi:rubrerythrin